MSASTNNSTTNISNRFYNVSLDGQLVTITSSDYFLPYHAQYLSLANSFFFLSSFVIFYVCFAIMILVLRQRKIPIKKNPKILFTIVVIFVAIQCFNLIIRAMYDIWNINAHYRFDGGQQVFKASYFLGMNVMGALSTWTFFWNYVFVFVILFFVQLMFWKTAWSLRAISKRFYHFFRILNIVIFSIFISIEILVVALIPFIEYASETGLIETNTRTNLTIGLFSALIWMFLFDTFTAVLSGICMVKGIRQNQSKFATKGQNSLLSLNKNNPFVVTLGLTIGLILCILCQLLAAGIATSTLSLDRTGLKVIWHFLSSLAVLIFAVLSLLLFYPMFIQTEKVLMKLNEEENSNNKSAPLSPKKQQQPIVECDFNVETKDNHSKEMSTVSPMTTTSPTISSERVLIESDSEPTPQSPQPVSHSPTRSICDTNSLNNV